LEEIIFITNNNLEDNGDVLASLLDEKEAIHLSWVRLFLRFHCLGLYDHIRFILALVPQRNKS
jgi:hypothetical protein